MPRKPQQLPPGVRRRPGRPYEIFYPGPDGRRVQETVGSDLREAVREREQRIAEVRAGTWTRADARKRESLTFDAWADTWLDKRASRPNPPRTLADDAARLRDHVRPALGSIALEALTDDHLRALLSDLRSKVSPTTGKPLSPNTIHNVWGTLAKCLRDGARELAKQGVAWVPPVAQLDDGEAPMRVERPRGAYSRGELESLITDARIPEDRRAFVCLLGLTGMRHDEAAGLRWRDVDFRAEPLPRIELTKQAGDRPLKEDKRGAGKRREIPMHPTLRLVLEAWRTSGFARTYGRHPRPDDYLVPSVADVREYRVSRTTQADRARLPHAWDPPAHRPRASQHLRPARQPRRAGARSRGRDDHALGEAGTRRVQHLPGEPMARRVRRHGAARRAPRAASEGRVDAAGAERRNPGLGDTFGDIRIRGLETVVFSDTYSGADGTRTPRSEALPEEYQSLDGTDPESPSPQNPEKIARRDEPMPRVIRARLLKVAERLLRRDGFPDLADAIASAREELGE